MPCPCGSLCRKALQGQWVPWGGTPTKNLETRDPPTRPFHAGDPWRLPFSPAGGLPNRLVAISVAIAGVAGTRDIGGGTRAA